MPSAFPTTDGPRVPDDQPFDHRLCANQHLHFTYARQAFATAGLPWSDAVLRRLHIVGDPDETDDPDGPGGRIKPKPGTVRSRYTQMLSNTALLLADENPYALKYAVFQGDTKATLLDQATLHGSILRLINDAMAMFNARNTHARWSANAFREALVNAAVHRDYRYSGPTLVSMFDHRIEIVSLGGLVEGLEVEDLLNGVCQPRNAWLTELMTALHFSENLGTGIPRIMGDYAQSAASPQLRVGPSSVVMVLPEPVLSESPWPVSQHDEREEPRADPEPAGAQRLDDAGHGTATRYMFPTASPPLTDDAAAALAGSRVIGVAALRTIALSPEALQAPRWRAPASHPVRSLETVTLHLLAESGVELSRGQIEERLGISKNQASYVLRSLVDSGQITRRGRSRATQYSLS